MSDQSLEKQSSKYPSSEKWLDRAVPQTLEYLQLWTSCPFCKDTFHQKPVDLIEQFLANPIAGSGTELPFAIQKLIFWHQNHGAKRVMEGDKTGWAEIGTMWKLIELFVFLESSVVKNEDFASSLGIQVEEDSELLWLGLHDYIGLATCGYLATGEYSSAKYLADHGEYLDDIIGTIYEIPCKETEEITDFVNGKKIENSVLDQWGETTEEFHKEVVSHYKPSPHHGCSTGFDGKPWWICPILGIAVCRLREVMGRETPLPDHPIMKTPMADIPTTFQAEQLNWINSIKEAISSIPITAPKKMTSRKKGKKA